MKNHRPLVLLLLLLLSAPLWAQQGQEQLAAHYYQSRQYDKAIELYEPLYQQTGNRYYYQMLLESYLATDRHREAERLIERRQKQHPAELSLYVDLGRLQSLKGERRKSERTLEAPIAKLGHDSQQLADLVQAYRNMGREDIAVRCYLFLRERDNNPTQYVMELASLYERMGNYQAMTDEYFALLDVAPGNIGSVQISLQRALNETASPELARGLRRTIQARIQKDPSNRQYLDMMIWFSLQQRDFQFAFEQARAIDQRFPDDGGEQLLRVAQIAHNNEAFAPALAAYAYLVKKGREGAHYFTAREGELRARFDQMKQGYSLNAKQMAALSADYQSALEELGKTAQTAQLMRNYAHLLAYYAHDLAPAIDLLYDLIELPQLPSRTRDEAKLELGDLLLYAGGPLAYDASLLYMQVEKANSNDVMGSEAKFRNARLSYFIHDFTWAKSQLDALRSSTSKLIANDAMQLSLLISDNMEMDSTFDMLELYATADLLLYRNQLDSAWEGFSAIETQVLSHPLLDEVLLQKARIRVKQERYAEADSLLQRLIDFYPNDILADDALLLQAEINEGPLENADRARDCYERIVVNYPTSLYTDRARRRFNELRAAPPAVPPVGSTRTTPVTE